MPFVEGQKQFLMGAVLITLTRFKESEEYLKEALFKMEQTKSDHFIFNCLFNLVIVYLNLADNKKLKEVVSKLEKTKKPSELERIRIVRAQFIYATEVGDIECAKIFLEKIWPLKCQMLENDITSHLINEFNFHLQVDDYHSAYNVIEEMRSYRTFQLSENFNFMKKLMDNLTKNITIYAYERDFKSMPLLYNQLKVIQALELGDSKEAKVYWNNLQQTWPGIYGEDFKYNSRKCLFSLCLNKYASNISNLNVVSINENTKIDKIIAILKSTPCPVSKSQLYEMVWGESLESKDDLQKLARIISEIRSTRVINIQTKKGTYFLSPSDIKKQKIG